MTRETYLLVQDPRGCGGVKRRTHIGNADEKEGDAIALEEALLPQLGGRHQLWNRARVERLSETHAVGRVDLGQGLQV